MRAIPWALTSIASVTIAFAVYRGQTPKALVKVSLLTFPGCPNSPKMKTNLEAAMKALHSRQRIEVIDITKLPASDPRRGYGAPTVLVGGKDLFGLAEPKPSKVASCRLYNHGVPTVSEIKKRLLQTASR